MNIITKPSSIKGSLFVPGSKSHTIRACLFSALSKGRSVIENPLPSADCLSAVRVIEQFGAKVTQGPDTWTIDGIGTHWKQPGFVIDVGDSGTLLHFITGIASTIDGYVVISGDQSICKRPIRQQLLGLRQLGAEAFPTRENFDAPPVILKGPVHAGLARIDGSLSQHVSGLLMAGALTKGRTRIELSHPQEIPFVLMTVQWLASIGIHVDYDEREFKWYEIEGPNEFPAINRAIPSDWEGVAFPLGAAMLTDSTLDITHLDCKGNQGDAAIVDVFREMGADIAIDEEKGCLTVHGGKRLHGVTVNCSNFPDALPMLSVVAAFADGVSRFTDIGVCRLKETDRISLMKKELEKLGAEVHEGPDFMEVVGGKKLHGGIIESYGDHRIAMAMAVCGMALPEGSVVVKDAECCAVSFPGFFDLMNTVGAGFKEEP